MAHTEKVPKPMRPKPTLRLSEDELPAIKDWKVGSTYRVELAVKQISMRQGDEYPMEGEKRNKKVEAVFEVIEAKALGERQKSDSDEEEERKDDAVEYFKKNKKEE